MNYTPVIDGFEGQDIQAKVGFWTGPKLLVNGAPAPRADDRTGMLLRRNDGRQVTATWKLQALGFEVPHLVVDGKEIILADPLRWYQWIFCALPLVLVFFGSILAAAFGVIGFSINLNIFRSDTSKPIKYVLSLLVLISTLVVYLVIYNILYPIVNK